MRMRLTWIAVALVLALGLASAASAQYTDERRSPIGLGLSVFVPTDSTLSDISSTWLGPVLQWNARFDRFDRPDLIVSVGWFAEDNQFEKASFFPISATYLKRIGEEAENTWYYGGGLGINFVEYERRFPFPQIDESSTEIGIHVVGGREFQGGWFGELRYDFGGSAGGADFNGFMLSVGTRLVL